MTTNFELSNTLKNYKAFGGVFSKSDLPFMGILDKFYIINLQDRDDGGGTHWVLLHNSNKYECIYFDSFGQPPPDVIVEFMKKSHNRKKLLYNDSQYQLLESIKCGEFCVLVAILLERGFTYKEILDKILSKTDFSYNEEVVRGIVKK